MKVTDPIQYAVVQILKRKQPGVREYVVFKPARYLRDDLSADYRMMANNGCNIALSTETAML
jgi:hypothetical protein